ncbi:ATP-binding protein [soil metagenome]
MLNPYTPGELPHVLVGRDVQLASIRSALGGVATFGRLSGAPYLFSAPRGIGKTSLLRAAQREANGVGFVTAWVSARDDESLPAAIVQAVSDGVAAAGLDEGERAGRWRDSIDRVSVEVGVPGVKVGAELRPREGAGQSGSATGLEQLLAATARFVREESRPGLMVVVDELQAGSMGDLRTWAYAAQHLQSEADSTPLALFGAGLPSLPDRLMDAATFAERFHFEQLQRLTPQATREAFTQPCEPASVSWQTEALNHAVEIAAGYPFMVQVLGHETWTAASPSGPGQFTLEHVRAGAERAVVRLQPMFRGRWSKATAAERRFLAAMAAAGTDVVERAVIAESLGRPTRGLSGARASLIDKGLIEPVEHGQLQFTTPGFRDFVREHT